MRFHRNNLELFVLGKHSNNCVVVKIILFYGFLINEYGSKKRHAFGRITSLPA